jgi:putative Mg2+ transporter-C (MgtC) family protein
MRTVAGLSVAELLLRFAVAVALGALIGFEREARNKAAGLRTHALVAVGAALFTMAGAYGFLDANRDPQVDPARIAAQVASGIGFIGAGAIIRDGLAVRGVTTAATLWTAAAIGVGAGSGFVVGTVAGTLLALAILLVFRLVSRRLQRATGAHMQLHVTYERGHGTLGPLLRTIEEIGTIERIRIEDEGDDVSRPGPRHLMVGVVAAHPPSVPDLVERLRKRDDVADVSFDA